MLYNREGKDLLQKHQKSISSWDWNRGPVLFQCPCGWWGFQRTGDSVVSPLTKTSFPMGPILWLKCLALLFNHWHITWFSMPFHLIFHFSLFSSLSDYFAATEERHDNPETLPIAGVTSLPVGSSHHQGNEAVSWGLGGWVGRFPLLIDFSYDSVGLPSHVTAL